MIFRRIELSDRAVVEPVLREAAYMSSDFTFTNLFAWQPLFKTLVAVEDEMVFLRFVDKGTVCYMMPTGRLSLAEALERILQDAKENDFPFVMKAVTPRMWDKIEAAMPGAFRFECDRMNYEYVYLSEKLISLSGKKLQPKRNHINRFEAENPGWEYFSIRTEEDIAVCTAMLREWITQDAAEDAVSKRFDFHAAGAMLRHFEALQVRGGAIRVNGRVVAFSLGEALTDDIFVVHVEKAFADITGAYAIINREFVRHEAANYTYINREEDIGMENLRKAKMSYCPDSLLEHKTVYPIG